MIWQDCPVKTAHKLFGLAAQYLTLIDQITVPALKHEYTFISDDWFKGFLRSDDFSPEHANAIVALELLDKAHLASITSLIRTRKWADALCQMHETENFVACPCVSGFAIALEADGPIYFRNSGFLRASSMVNISPARCVGARIEHDSPIEMAMAVSFARIAGRATACRSLCG